MKTKCYFFSFLLLLILGKNTKAELLGADVSYQCTTTSGVYKVNLKVYRSCQGIPICNGCSQPIPNGTLTGCTTSNAGFGTPIVGADSSCLGTNFGSYTLAIQSGGINGYDIIQTCDSVKTICTNCNTRTAGTFASGIEVYIFEGNVNLNSLPTSCCKAALGFSFCCRNTAITNFATGNFYTECIINRCLTSCNNAPVFTNEAVPLVCAGVDYVYNLGAIDPDGDSLSYAFGSSLTNQGTSVNYNPPYSAGYPFAYLGAPNQNAPYPAGLRIDPITGDVLFRPSGVWLSNLIIEVTQWKKLGNTRINAGVTRRDIQFQTQLCNGNLAPRIKIYQNGILQNTQSFSVNVNQQICLDIVATDQANLSATPNPILADSTDLTWNNPLQFIPVMANATWTRNYILGQRSTSGSLNDSFKFCWTPPTSAIRDQPYLFTVTGRDRFCPLNASAIRGISIKVNTPLFAKVSFDSTNRKVFCANKTLPVSMSYKVNGITLTAGNIFYAHLSDSLGNFNTPILIGSKISNANTGSINLNIPSGLSTTGNYKLRLRVSSDSAAYDPYFPISIAPGFTQPVIFSNTDSICKGSNVLLSVLPANSNYTFKWMLNNTIINGATNDSLFVDTAANIKAIVSNEGCSDTSLVKPIVVFPKPVVSFTAPAFICFPGAPVNFTNTSTISSGTLTYQWLFSDSTWSTAVSPVKTITNDSDIGVYLTAVSDHNCMASLAKTTPVHKIINPLFVVNDNKQCVKNNSFTFTNQTNNQGNTVNYTWNFGTGNNIASNTNTQTYQYANADIYNVKLIADNGGCKDSIILPVTVLSNPGNVNFIINQNVQCLRNNYFIFTNTSTPNNNILQYYWQLGDGNISNERSPSMFYINSNTYRVTLVVVANGKCIDSVSHHVTVLPHPVVGNITGNINVSNPGMAIPYSVAAQSNITCNWGAYNGTIQSGQGSNAVSVIWNNSGMGKLWALIADSNGCDDSTLLYVSIGNVGLQNMSLKQELRVYPNPAKSLITISSQSNRLAGKKYTINNTVGQMMLTGKLGVEETSINIESLSSGFYLLSVEGISNQSIKIIKE